jgi:flagellar biosynthetic protein FliP
VLRRLVVLGLLLAASVAVAIAEAPRVAYQESFAVTHGATRSGTAAKTVRRVKDSAVKPAVASAPTQASTASVATKVAQDSLADLFGKTNDASTPWAIVLGLTLLTLLPSMLLAMTPMVRLLVVFHFLRQALGTQTAPSNQVLMGLALMMTWFLMQPVLRQVDRQALTPYRNGQITMGDAMERGSLPVKQYLLHYSREKDLAVFVNASHTARPSKPEDLPMAVVAPAYILSELKAGFQIGAVLFLPFLLVDFLVASVTTSIGMLQLSPVVISTPVKILLFVMVDGWSLLADQLLKSF